MVTTARHGALGWVSVHHLQHIIARGEAAGLKMDEWLQAAGLSRAILADPETPVPVTAIESMLAALSRQQADPLLGLRLAEDVQPATFGALGLILQTCTTSGDMAKALIKCYRYRG